MRCEGEEKEEANLYLTVQTRDHLLIARAAWPNNNAAELQ